MDDYIKLSSAAAFVELLSVQTVDLNIRRHGRQILNLLLDILCEIMTSLRSLSIEISDHIEQNPVPHNQRQMSTTRRISWTYILSRDLLTMLENIIEQYEFRDVRLHTAHYMPNVYNYQQISNSLKK